MVPTAFPDPKRPAAPMGLPLQALTASSLQDRFYSWAGLSGRRYVCTVFKIGDESALRDFSGAAIIGVSNSGGHRRPICVLKPSDFRTSERRHAMEGALRLGVNEWHLHFTLDLRRLAEDLLAC